MGDQIENRMHIKLIDFDSAIFEWEVRSYIPHDTSIALS